MARECINYSQTNNRGTNDIITMKSDKFCLAQEQNKNLGPIYKYLCDQILSTEDRQQTQVTTEVLDLKLWKIFYTE
jgi:hypothetical protein